MEQTKQLKRDQYYYPVGEPIKYELQILGEYSFSQLTETVKNEYAFPEQSNKVALEHNIAHSRILFTEGKRLLELCNHRAEKIEKPTEHQLQKLNDDFKDAIKLLIASIGWYDMCAIDNCLALTDFINTKDAFNEDEWKSIETFVKSVGLLRLKYMTIRQTVQFVKDRYHSSRPKYMEDLSKELIKKGKELIESCLAIKKNGGLSSENDKERWQEECNLGVKYILASLYEKNNNAIIELSKSYQDSILEIIKKEDYERIKDIMTFVKEQN